MKKVKTYKQHISKINFTEEIRNSDLIDMCKFGTEYFREEDKKICSKFLEDNMVTDDLLLLYCHCEIESWGDMYDVVEFIYGDKKIYGKYFDNDYPAKVSFNVNSLYL